jgi:hypothetical protein
MTTLSETRVLCNGTHPTYRGRPTMSQCRTVLSTPGGTTTSRALLHTGFRRSELLSLTWQDVDFQRKMITGQAAYAKNGESRRAPMNDVLLSTLKACKIKHPPEEPVFGPSGERLTAPTGQHSNELYVRRGSRISPFMILGILLPVGSSWPGSIFLQCKN